MFSSTGAPPLPVSARSGSAYPSPAVVALSAPAPAPAPAPVVGLGGLGDFLIGGDERDRERDGLVPTGGSGTGSDSGSLAGVHQLQPEGTPTTPAPAVMLEK
jgi:hypothetical protein